MMMKGLKVREKLWRQREWGREIKDNGEEGGESDEDDGDLGESKWYNWMNGRD